MITTIKSVARFYAYILCFVAIAGTALFAAPYRGIDPPVKKQSVLITEEWKIFAGTEDVLIYFAEVHDKDNVCIKYRLKIVNKTAESKTITFGLKGGLSRECLHVMNLDFRNFTIGANETLTGSDSFPALLLPATKENVGVEEMVQNLTIQ